MVPPIKKQILFALIAWHFAIFSASATIAINFDIDASGNPVAAPFGFTNAVRLSELYAPLGVHFWGPDGPSGHDGGAVLDQDSNFDISAHSGRNFLAFNRLSNVTLMDGGRALDPETISFDTLATSVSIFAAGGFNIKTFLMQGFDANGVLVASDTVTTQQWGELEIASPSGIKSVQLSCLTPPENAVGFVFDDLSVDFVPEPSTISLLTCAIAIGLVLGLRRKGV
jgi:hypothetical protein